MLNPKVGCAAQPRVASHRATLGMQVRIGQPRSGLCPPAFCREIVPMNHIFASSLIVLALSATGTVSGQQLPYPPSPIIAGIEWAPKEKIIRQAKDGDNWPITWADDDALYTTWGDGTGFV